MSYQLVSEYVKRLKLIGITDHLIRRNPLYYSKYVRLHRYMKQKSKTEMEEWSRTQIAKILKVAAKTPYGVSLGANHELSSWPMLTKDKLRNHEARFQSPGIWKLIKIPASTSGSTGVPLKLFRTPLSVTAEQSFIDSVSQDMGLDVKRMKAAVLRGDNVKPIDDREAPFWRYNTNRKKLILSSNHLDRHTAKYYWAELVNYQPDALMAYPTSLEALCGYLKDAELNLKIPYVITSSEVLSPKTRKLAEDVLRCKVLDYYGQAERVAFAYAYEQNKYYFHPYYSYVEFDFHSTDDEYDYYEIIGTTYWNTLMPLVRYRTGDLMRVRKGTSEEELHDIQYGIRSFDSVVGRAEEYLITKDGTKLIGINHIPWNVQHIHQVQIIQESDDYVRILVVPSLDFSSQDREQLLDNAYTKIPRDIRIDIEVVDKLERTPQGKAPSLIRRQEGQK